VKHWLGPLAILVIASIGAHWATLALTPGIIMDRALATLEARGVALHAFTAPQRISPETQVVVRSSPDLFYSLCRYDFDRPEGGAITVRMARWPDYQSLSFFDADTNNFATLRAPGETVTVRLHGPDTPGESAKSGVDSPTMRGVVLIRRLAPTPETFAAAAEAARADACTPAGR
jgi:uncharacterized membrane protein